MTARTHAGHRLAIITRRLRLLGNGQFGTVFKGKLEGDPNDVAIKVPQPNCTSSNLKSMLSEIKIMICVGQHPNIVSILGAYTKEIRQGAYFLSTW